MDRQGRGDAVGTPHDPGKMDGKWVNILTRGGLSRRFNGWIGIGIAIISLSFKNAPTSKTVRGEAGKDEQS
jgi:hypothetical protein